MSPRKNMEYYAVVKGRVDKPTIYSSWGHAHPRVTGCKAKHQAFLTLDEARDYMRKHVNYWEEEISDTAAQTTPLRNNTAYYAVAYGENRGIVPEWYGSKGVLDKIHEFSGACYKRFRTELQAQAFIEDWNEAFADAWRWEVTALLKEGHVPQAMRLDTKRILSGKKDACTIDDMTNDVVELRIR